MDGITKNYISWIANKLDRDDKSFLNRLYNIEYQYFRPMDGNRYEDGIDLRYRFGSDNRIPDSEICCELDNKPCSVLEMMTALSIRIEKNIMYNPNEGDRTGIWFNEMIIGMNLVNDDTLQSKVDDFELGRIGIFGDDHPKEDIWYQAMRHLDAYRKPLWQEE